MTTNDDLKCPPGCRLDALAYRSLREELLRRRLVEESDEARADRIATRQALLARYAATKAMNTVTPIGTPVPMHRTGGESHTFLCEATLKEAGEAIDTRDAVQRYLKQLNLPAPPAPRGAATASHCETFTQDTDMSPSSGSPSSASSDHGAASPTTSHALESTVRKVVPTPPTVAPTAAVDEGEAWARVDFSSLGEDEENGSLAPNPASSFLFAATPQLIKAGIGRVSCLQFCPVQTIGIKKPITDTRLLRGHLATAAENDCTLVACGTITGDVWLLSINSRGSISGDSISFSGHRGEVNDVNWSDDGLLLISVSADATVAVWDVSRREKIREVNSLDPALCGRFLPQNNNFFIVGVAAAVVRVFNLSTGIQVKKVKVSDPVHALAMDDGGLFVFGASSKGVLQAFAVLLDLSQIRKVSTLLVGPERQLGAISWQSGHGMRPLQHPSGAVRMTRVDYVAANVVDAVLIVAFTRTFRSPGETSETFNMALRTGAWCALRVLRTIPSPSTTLQRSVFCERPSQDAHLVVACATVDGCVDLWSCTAARSDKMVTLSPGYPSAPLGVAWDASNSILAAGTDTGDVITWRRFRIAGGDAVDAAFQKSVAAGGPGRESSQDSRDDVSDDASSHHDDYSESNRVPTSNGSALS